MVRFAVVTDIHHGPDSGRRRGSQALRLLDRFVNVVSKRSVDFTVDLGDHITSTDKHEDLKRLSEIGRLFNRLGNPHHYVHGNHDLKRLSRDDLAGALGAPGGSYIAEQNGYSLIFWNAEVDKRDADGFLTVSNEDLDWLKEALAGARRPAILFSHIPLDNTEAHELQTAPEYKHHPHVSFYRQGPQIREMLEQSGKLILCLAGDRHRNQRREIGGIHYLTLQSLVQQSASSRRARGAYAIIEIDDAGTIRVEGHGTGQKSFTLDVGGYPPPALQAA